MSIKNTALKALLLKARRQVYTLLEGNHLSKLYADGYDFAELREYQIGDDVRKINWTITAKYAKPYIKELHANRELSIVVVCLMDAGLYFGSKKNADAKQKKMTEIFTMLAYASELGGDIFTGLCYTSTHTYTTPPTKQRHIIEQFSQTLFNLDLLGSTLAKQEAIIDVFKRIHKPSLVFILSDFLEEIDLSLLAQKHEVIAIVIRHKEEEHPLLLGETTLLNPHNNKSLETYFGKKTKQVYKKKFSQNEEKRIAHFTRFNIPFVTIYTDEEALGKLIGLFRQR